MSKKINATRLPKRFVTALLVGFLIPQAVHAGRMALISHQDLAAKVQDAKTLLQQGVNVWDPEKMQQARDKLLKLHLQENEKNQYLLYYLALADYRMATFHISSGAMEETGTHITQGKKFLESAIDLDPDWSEPYALYATLLGFEIALNPDEAMTISFEIGDYFGSAFAKDPDNPRAHFLKGTAELYTPESYGGGPDVALDSMETALACYEKEKITDPLQPSWGKAELLTFMGIAYNQKGETQKAKEHLTKALSLNPDLQYARDELAKIKN
jgi:tetratricopeptide (TPR) repeat protein